MNATTRRRAPLPAVKRLLGAPGRVVSRGMANPAVLRRGMSLWPPFLGAGVVVEVMVVQSKGVVGFQRVRRLNPPAFGQS